MFNVKNQFHWLQKITRHGPAIDQTGSFNRDSWYLLTNNINAKQFMIVMDQNNQKTQFHKIFGKNENAETIIESRGHRARRLQGQITS